MEIGLNLEIICLLSFWTKIQVVFKRKYFLNFFHMFSICYQIYYFFVNSYYLYHLTIED